MELGTGRKYMKLSDTIINMWHENEDYTFFY